jgi:hypothetical protein
VSKLAPTFLGSLQVRPIGKASYPPFSLERLPKKPMKRSLKFVPLIIVMIALLVFTTSCGKQDANPNNNYSFNIGSLLITLRPILPPKALSALPSDYLQVNVDVGSFHFSTNDTAFTCFESLIPFVFTEEIDWPGLFVVAYNDCRTGTTRPTSQLEAALGAQGSLLPNQGDLIAMWTFPQSDLPGCTTDSLGATSCTLQTPTPVPPATLDVSPSPNCPMDASGNYICTVTLTLVNSGSVDWSVSSESDLPNATFDPSSGTLSSTDQTSQQVTVTIPGADCPAGGHFDVSWTGSNTPTVEPFTCST